MFFADLYQLWMRVPIPTQDWLKRNYHVGVKVCIVLLAVSVFNRYSAQLLRQLLTHAVRREGYGNKSDREKRLKTLTGIAIAATKAGSWVLAGIVILDLLDINTAPFFASAGILGAGVIFGAQNLIKDFIAGVFILSENQYRVGDTVDIMGVSGTVQSIGLRTTVLRDQNGSVHHIPNGSIVVTTNKTMGHGAINLDITVAADTDTALLERVINRTGVRLASNVELKDSILETPHFSRISDYTGAGVTIKVTGKTVGGKQLQVKSALLSELKNTFEKNKIKIATTPAAATTKKK